MKKQETEAFHSRLTRLRKKSGLSMKKVAEALEIPESTYREWEYGRAIQGEPYVKLGKVFGVSIYELLGGSRPEMKALLSTVDELEEGLKKLRIQVGSF